MSAAPPPVDVLGLTRDDLARALRGVGAEPFRADQVLAWIWERRTSDFARMSNLPRALRERLADAFVVAVPRVASRTPAGDGSEKFLFELTDGVRVEAVHMKAGGRGTRSTVCVSSQAGCAVDCAFCVTGRMGAGRNLGAGEIAGQYLAIASAKSFAPREANVVFMGMGEPLLNVPNVIRALDLLSREVSPRRTTVSTSGVVPGLDALAGLPARPNLAVSLHAADDETRTRLVPINAKWPLADLAAALRRWPLEAGRRLTFEVVLVAGINDGLAHARAIARWVRPFPAKVNAIPLNESAEWLPGLKRPSRETVDAWARAVRDAGADVTVRWSKGLDAEAACGQLKGRETPRRPRKEPR